MDYSLIVGIHDLERQEQDLPDAPPLVDDPDDVSEDENGVDQDEVMVDAGFAPTPPDSPQPIPIPIFSGEIDTNLEKFGIKSSPGKGISGPFSNMCSA